MLVELGLVEQRYRAVLEVLDGAASVTDVARRYGVGRQTVHTWLRRYAAEGLPGLADRSSRPSNCPHQMPPAVEARVVEMRRQHRGWGPRTILSRLARAGVSPLPSRSGIYRALVRHQLIDPKRRRRRPSDYKRWERSRAMELWQMDITLGVRLQDGSRPSIVTGIDDHSHRLHRVTRESVRYEHPAPGDLLHLDVKKLARILDGGGHRAHGRSSETPRGRGAGLDYLHVAVDDHSRYAHVETLPDERGATCAAFGHAPRSGPRAGTSADVAAAPHAASATAS